MDILNPELVWVDNRCYRKLPIKGSEKIAYFEDDLYPTEPSEYIKEDRDEHDSLPIMHEGDKFWISIPVPGPLIGLVRGRKSRTISNIEESTDTKIKFPSSEASGRLYQHRTRDEQGVDVVITGTKRNSVSQAYQRIERITSTGRWKVGDYTHFISIPMNNSVIQEGFLKFKKDVLTNCKSVRGISASIFESPAKLHLTVVMLTLFDDKEKEIAKAALNNCKSEILELLDGKVLHVEIKGIEYMNDDPAEVDVLYGKVQETDGDNSLQMIADRLAEALINVNLARREYDSVKLHVTLMKSRNKEGQRDSFDARPLLQRYSDYVFGKTKITEIHISARFTGGETNYYTPSAYVTL